MKTCKWCDKPLRKGERYFCCASCKAQWNKQMRFSRGNRGAFAERVRDRKPDVTIDDVVEGMEETGLQYGEFVRRFGI